MKLASGTAPVLKLRAAGVATGLGTDGAASNNDLDMFEAMRQAAFLHKLQSGDPRALAGGGPRNGHDWRGPGAGSGGEDRVDRAGSART
jgi:cytosine/adenosine deaminase-related metal-dependent hydrolase